MIDPAELKKAAEARDAKLVKELLIDVQSAAYNHAAAYTTVVIFGGYAALFTIWSYTKDHLTERTTYWVALLLGISVLTFVFFEVFKMLLISREIMKMRKLIVKEHPPSALLAERERLAHSTNKLVQRVVVPIWIVALVVTILTGGGAAILLLSAFASSLAFPANPAP